MTMLYPNPCDKEVCYKGIASSMVTFYFLFLISEEEYTWSDREHQLAAWCFRKWKYHQFTSLRVCLLQVFEPHR